MEKPPTVVRASCTAGAADKGKASEAGRNDSAIGVILLGVGLYFRSLSVPRTDAVFHQLAALMRLGETIMIGKLQLLILRAFPNFRRASRLYW